MCSPIGTSFPPTVRAYTFFYTMLESRARAEDDLGKVSRKKKKIAGVGGRAEVTKNDLGKVSRKHIFPPN